MPNFRFYSGKNCDHSWYLCLIKSYLLLFTLELTLKMTLNYLINNKNRRVIKNPFEKSYYTCSYHYLCKNHISACMTLKLTL